MTSWTSKSKRKKKKVKHEPISQIIINSLNSNKLFYSFEYSAARDADPNDLFARIQRMTNDLMPSWIDITWGFGNVGQRSIEMAKRVQKELSIPVLLHFILTDRTTQQIEQDLQAIRNAGIRNLLALRGYTQAGYDKWQPTETISGSCPPPQHTDGLVSFIKERHADWFSIGVAGFPEGHPESTNLSEDVMHLKLKIDAGGEFIICQFCYDANVFHDFVKRCRAVGISVPIIPGVMPLTEYSTAKLLSDTWNVKLGDDIYNELKRCEEEDEIETGREAGKKYVVDLCDNLLNVQKKKGKGESGGIHFFVYDAEYEVRGLIDGIEKLEK